LETDVEFGSPLRSRLEIIRCILKSSNKRLNRMMLMHVCQLTLSQLESYEDFLVKAGLFMASRTEDGAELYETTKKGREFLRDYDRVESVFGSH